MAYVHYQPNPVGRNVGDCAVRAVAKALDIDWEAAYALIVANGFQMGDMPSSDAVWGSVLRQYGFYRAAIPNTCPDCYTVADFAHEHPRGTYVLGTGGHVCTLRDGDVYDSWDSSHELPQFYWYRKDEA